MAHSFFLKDIHVQHRMQFLLRRAFFSLSTSHSFLPEPQLPLSLFCRLRAVGGSHIHRQGVHMQHATLILFLSLFCRLRALGGSYVHRRGVHIQHAASRLFLTEFHIPPSLCFAGYVLWVAATSTGEVYTCNTQDDGYGGTLVQTHAANHAGELGRKTDPFLPGKVRVKAT